MIKCNLCTYMGNNRMKIQDVCDKTGLARNTVGNLYRDTATRVDYNTMSKLCELFQCNVGELFEFIPSPQEWNRDIIMTLSRFLNKCNVWNRCNIEERKEILTYVITKNLPNDVEFEWWNGLQEPSVYAGYKQICLGTGNDLATFSTSRTK